MSAKFMWEECRIYQLYKKQVYRNKFLDAMDIMYKPFKSLPKNPKKKVGDNLYK